MEIRQLRCWNTLAQTRHVRRAAEQLHTAQSPLSAAIKVAAAGKQPVTSQLYFPGGDYVDVAQAVEPELVPGPVPTYDFPLDRA